MDVEVTKNSFPRYRYKYCHGKDDNKPIHDPTISFSDLPTEIIDHYILKYFDFRDWLRLVIVCKKWLAVARQSVLHKQLVVKESRDVDIACSILAEYTIQTLVLNMTSPLDQLERIINASTSVKTLVLHPRTKYRGSAQFKFIHIETLSVGDWSLLKHFPNVTRLKIPIARADLLENNEFPLVQELEIEANQTSFEYYEGVKREFPSLTKLYVVGVQMKEKDFKTLEEIGNALDVQIIGSNPYLSQADGFSLTVSYHEYFNGCGNTPLKRFLEFSQHEKSKALFTKYSSKQYEKDLYHREPQFNFPLRCQHFSPYVWKINKKILSKQCLLAMIECQFITPWHAFSSQKVSWSREEIIKLLQATNDSGNTVPPKKAIEAILQLVNVSKFTLPDIIDIIGNETFKAIASVKSKNNCNTLLHEYVKSNDISFGDYQNLVKYSNVNAVNHKNQNAATLAFNNRQWKCWQHLVAHGADVQCEQYLDIAANCYLEQVLEHCISLATLELFDQKFLQRLLWCLAGGLRFSSDEQRDPEVLEELVRLGANPQDQGQNDPLVCVMARSGQITTYWKLIERWGLNINECDCEGYTPLMRSIEKSSYKRFEYLLAKKADPNVLGTSCSGEVRHAALLASTSEERYLQLLLDYGADFTVEDEDGNTVINRVVREKYNTYAIRLLANCVSLDKPNNDGYTPLAVAISTQQEEVVRQLISAGADVNTVAGPLNQSPLQIALDYGFEEIVKVLLKTKRIDITIKDTANRSFLYYALKKEGYASLRALFRDPFNVKLRAYNTPENIEFIKSEVLAVLTTPELSHFKTPLMLLALTSVDFVKFWVDVLGVDVNTEDQNGDTLLTMITVETERRVVEFLIARGANVNHQNKQLNTALMLVAEMTKNFHCCRLEAILLRAGASLTIKNMWGISPLELKPNIKQGCDLLNTLK